MAGREGVSGKTGKFIHTERSWLRGGAGARAGGDRQGGRGKRRKAGPSPPPPPASPGSEEASPAPGAPGAGLSVPLPVARAPALPSVPQRVTKELDGLF